MPFRFVDEQPRPKKSMLDDPLFRLMGGPALKTAEVLRNSIQDDPLKPTNPVATGAVESVLDNILGIPNAMNRIGNRAQGGINSGLRSVLSDDVADFIVPPIDVDAGEFDTPSAREVLSGIDAGLGVLGGKFDVSNTFEEGMRNRAQLAEESPNAFQAGGYLGDGVSILMGRAPFVKATGRTDLIAPKVEGLLSKALKPDLAKKLSRVIGRPAEAAIEGGVLAAIKDADPVAAAGYAAGSQVAGLAGLKLAETAGVADMAQGKLLKGGAKLAGTAFAVGGLLQFMESGIPGDGEFWLQSVQQGFDKIIPLMAVGAVSSLTGAGRVSGNLPGLKGEIPTQIADAMTAIPRGALESALTQMVKNGEVKALMDQYVNSPESLTESEIFDIQEAFDAGELERYVEERKPGNFRFLDEE